MVLVYVERECFKAKLAPLYPRSTAAEHIYDDIIPHVISMNWSFKQRSSTLLCASDVQSYEPPNLRGLGPAPGGTSSSRRALVSYLY